MKQSVAFVTRAILFFLLALFTSGATFANNQQPQAGQTPDGLSTDEWSSAQFDNESLPLKWYDCGYEATRLEAQGEILAGRFVKSYSGIQFADKNFIKQISNQELQNLSLHEKDPVILSIT